MIEKTIVKNIKEQIQKSMELAKCRKCGCMKETFFGFKLHTLNTLGGYLTDYILTSANIDDRVALWHLVQNKSYLTLIADKGYIG